MTTSKLCPSQWGMVQTLFIGKYRPRQCKNSQSLLKSRNKKLSHLPCPAAYVIIALYSFLRVIYQTSAIQNGRFLGHPIFRTCLIMLKRFVFLFFGPCAVATEQKQHSLKPPRPQFWLSCSLEPALSYPNLLAAIVVVLCCFDISMLLRCLLSSLLRFGAMFFI